MEDLIFQKLLDQLPKNTPFKICRLCIKETSGLLEIANIADFSIMYKNITNVQVVYLFILFRRPTTIYIALFIVSKRTGTPESRLPSLHTPVTTMQRF